MRSIMMNTILVLGASATLAQAATMTFTPADSGLNSTNITTANAGGVGNVFLVTGTSGVGTNAYTINYNFTSDLSSIGGPASASFDFAVTFSTADGVIADTSAIGVDGTSDTVNAIESGEAITLSFSQSASPYYTFNGFKTSQAYGTGDAQVTSDVTNNTVTGDNANFSYTPFTSTFTMSNVDSGSDTFGLGYMTYHITAEVVPEPSSTALLGLGGLALILRRRK